MPCLSTRIKLALTRPGENSTGISSGSRRPRHGRLTTSPSFSPQAQIKMFYHHHPPSFIQVMNKEVRSITNYKRVCFCTCTAPSSAGHPSLQNGKALIFSHSFSTNIKCVLCHCNIYNLCISSSQEKH